MTRTGETAPALETARLRLRPPVLDDLQPLHEILGDPRAMAFWSTLPHRSLEETETFLEGMISANPPEGEEFVVELTGRVIGKVGFWRFPEIGFIFDPACWGRGLASEAVRPVVDRAFRVHALPSIEADVDPRNAASRRLLERLGFEETGRAERTFQIGDNWYDSIYLRLTAERWEAAGGS